MQVPSETVAILIILEVAAVDLLSHDQTKNISISVMWPDFHLGGFKGKVYTLNVLFYTVIACDMR